MYFKDDEVVTRLDFGVDADNLSDAVDRSCAVAEMLNFSALRVGPVDSEEDKLDYTSRVVSSQGADSASELESSLLSAAYSVLEKFEFAEDRYVTTEDEGGTFADLITPERFFPRLGVRVVSMLGRLGSQAAEDYVSAEFSFAEHSSGGSARAHSVFVLPDHGPNDAVIRVHLWLAATDLSTAVGLIRKPLLGLNANAVEIVPAGVSSEEGYHAALIRVVTRNEDAAQEVGICSAVREAAQGLALSDDDVWIEQCGSEMIGIAWQHQHTERASEGARRVEGGYVRIGGDPLGVVKDDVSPPEADEELEDLDDPAGDGFTDEERAEFLQLCQEMDEVMSRVWLVCFLDVDCSAPLEAEEVLRWMTDELLSRISSEEMQIVPGKTLLTETGSHRLQTSIGTCENNIHEVLDRLMNSLPDGMWSSRTRPWETSQTGETVIHWRPHCYGDTNGITDLLVHARYGPPWDLQER